MEHTSIVKQHFQNAGIASHHQLSNEDKDTHPQEHDILDQQDTDGSRGEPTPKDCSLVSPHVL